MEKLSKWANNIVNHFWYCCRTCDGDVKKLKVSVSVNVIINLLQIIHRRSGWDYYIIYRMNMNGFLAGVKVYKE